VSTVQNTSSGVADRAVDKVWLDVLAGVILATSPYVRPGDRGVSVLFVYVDTMLSNAAIKYLSKLTNYNPDQYVWSHLGNEPLW